MDTTVSVTVPAWVPDGRVPNPSRTDSPSSSSVSCVAVKVKLFAVSLAPKVMLAGTLE